MANMYWSIEPIDVLMKFHTAKMHRLPKVNVLRTGTRMRAKTQPEGITIVKTP